MPLNGPSICHEVTVYSNLDLHYLKMLAKKKISLFVALQVLRRGL